MTMISPSKMGDVTINNEDFTIKMGIQPSKIGIER
jgi:hypothetical protein